MPLIHSQSGYVRRAVIGKLGEAGPKGLPALRVILNEEPLLRYYEHETVSALVKGGGDRVGAELTEVVRSELTFWSRVGPGLRKNWWNGVGLSSDQVDGLRHHYSKTLATLQGLDTIRFNGCQEVVKDFREFWRSLPQLGGELDQMIKACDKVLHGSP